MLQENSGGTAGARERTVLAVTWDYHWYVNNENSFQPESLEY